MLNNIAAVATIEILQLSANATLSTIRFVASGRGYELTRFRAGRVELYEEYSDSPGLFAFVAYLDDVASHLPASHSREIAIALDALNTAHDAHWAAYLPGAAQWSQPSY